MSWQRWFGVLGVWLCVSCGGSSALNRGFSRPTNEHIDVPDEVEMYSTEAAPDGVVGGSAEQLSSDIAEALAKRGASATPDGALAATASWVLREVNEARGVSLTATEAAARRFGFAGVIASTAGFSVDSQNGDAWRTSLGMVPANQPITRYGLSVSNSGRTAAVVFGAVELSVAPFSRHLAPSDPLELHGELGARYTSAHVYLTKSDGTVEEKRMLSRKIEVSYRFATPGEYRLEVMGDGVTGPVIVLNVPIYVGITEQKLRTSSGHVTSPAEGEERMLELLNQSRKAAAVGALQPDDELRAIALAHSSDMVEHNFFGHVSPTTGTTADRARRSGVVVAAFGENVAEADSAEAAHDGLMGSPGHRANMLSAQFTHVGIAAVSMDRQQLAFTLIFARRPNPATMPRNAAQVEAAFLALRAKKGLSAPASDPTYRAAADAGAQAYVEARRPTADIAVQAENAALAREVQRRKQSRPAACSFLTEILELDQLEQASILFAPGIRRFGVGARLREDDHGSRLAVMMLLEGAPCQ